MSHNHSTNDSWFEFYFEDRFAPVEATLSIWGVKLFPSKGDLARDEALQHARIVMWEQYSGDPEPWAAKTPQIWVAYCKQVYEWFILHEKAGLCRGYGPRRYGFDGRRSPFWQTPRSAAALPISPRNPAGR